MRHSVLEKILVVLLCAPLAGVSQLSFSQETTASETSNVLLGRIFQAGEEKIPVQGATVRAYNVGTGQLYSTTTIEKSGNYIFAGLADGSYEFTVETPAGNYYAPKVITLSGGMRQKLSFSLSQEALPESVRSRLQRRGIPESLAVGVANTETDGSGPGGRAGASKTPAIIAGSILGALLLIEVVDDDEGSPFGP